MRGSIALRKTIATHPRMIALVAATVAGCLALLVTLISGLVGASTASAASTTYTVKEIGPLPGGTLFQVNDINASGQVVGSSYNPSTEQEHAFLWEDDGDPNTDDMIDLGTLPDATCSTSVANGINDSGHIVGFSCTSTGDMHAFLYSGGQMKDLGTLDTGCPGPPPGNKFIYSLAWDINASGKVVGWSCTSDSGNHAFLYSGGQMKDLGTLGSGAASAGHAINASGQVVGYSNILPPGEPSPHAFLWEDDGDPNTDDMKNLGTLSRDFCCPQSEAFDINRSGQVVGYSHTTTSGDGAPHAFLWEDDGDPNTVDMKDLKTLGGTTSRAEGINYSGQVVGSSSTTSGRGHAFLYSHSDGLMQDLNTLIPADSGWELRRAIAINTSGQIIGSGIINGRSTTFLATPDTPTPTPDSDGDGVMDDKDNCINVANENQEDTDADGVGDACEEPPQMSIADTTVNEGNSGTSDATFTVTISEASTNAVTVDYATEDGTATQPDDYQQTQGTLTFEANQTTATVTVQVSGDTADEPDESFSVLLSNPQHADIADGEGSGTIVDDDEAAPIDGDDDGVADAEDNCPQVANTDQADGDSNGVGDACDTPKVVSTSPATIAPSANVTATFSEAMDASPTATDGDPSTITATTFKLVKLNSDGSTTRVTATVSYAATTKKAKLDPASNLKLGATYKATVTSGTQDLANNALDQNPNMEGNQNKTWKFTVK